MGVLRLVPIFCGTQADLLPPLTEKLAAVFRLRVEIEPPGFDPERAFDPSRGQHNSRIFLAQLLEDTPPEVDRVLGVTSVDLFIPVLTFVFGEAQLDGRAAVVSTHRLAAELYGLPANPPGLFERLTKEAIHELGHTYNLVHCFDNRCVMASSTYAEEIDLKSERFCDRCREELGQALEASSQPVSSGGSASG
jgi:archaemetzincin